MDRVPRESLRGAGVSVELSHVGGSILLLGAWLLDCSMGGGSLCLVGVLTSPKACWGWGPTEDAGAWGGVGNKPKPCLRGWGGGVKGGGRWLGRGAGSVPRSSGV